MHSSVSKASVSTNARLLADQGVIERVTRPGDRRDYYHVAPDLFSRMMTQRLARWQRFTEAVGEARRTLPLRSERVRARPEATRRPIPTWRGHREGAGTVAARRRAPACG